jgi:hypothetical protein
MLVANLLPLFAKFLPKVNAMKNLPDQVTDGGWSVQVYSGDRRLLCSLDPSHIWMLVLGIFLGLVMGISWVRVSPPTETQWKEPAESPLWKVD